VFWPYSGTEDLDLNLGKGVAEYLTYLTECVKGVDETDPTVAIVHSLSHEQLSIIMKKVVSKNTAVTKTQLFSRDNFSHVHTTALNNILSI